MESTRKEGMMKATFLEDYDKPLVVKEIEIPKPKSGEVLIKIEAATINPSDLGFLKRPNKNVNYMRAEGEENDLPLQVGVEGSGTVIASGGGFMARNLVGKRVSFATTPGKSGSWSEYAVTQAMMCCPLAQEVSFEHGACGIVNPFTAMAFLRIIKKEQYPAVIQTAAASQLGRMMVKILKKEGIKTINIIRRPEQKKILEDLGADVIINSEEPNFEETLRAKAEELNATCLFEAISGDITQKLVRALPRNSTCYIYGKLAKEELGKIDFHEFLTNNKSIKPFFLPNWLKEQWFFTKIGVVRQVQNLLRDELKPEISKKFPVDQVNEALAYYTSHMTEGKVLITPKSE